MELASSVPMKVLYREKWESVPKGHIVSVSIREGREKTTFLIMEEKRHGLWLTLTTVVLSAMLGVILICLPRVSCLFCW